MFDLLEARTNRAILQKLANARAIIGANEVPVIFDAEFKNGTVGMVGMGASCPQMYIGSDAVPPGFIGSTLIINGVDWHVAERQPDGAALAGIDLVILERP